MKIAIVTPWEVSPVAVGGTERYTVDLAEGLSNLGHQVGVFALSGSEVEMNGVTYRSLGILDNSNPYSEYDLRAYGAGAEDPAFYDNWAEVLENSLDVSNYDIVQINSFLFLKAWRNSPRLLTIHTNPYEYSLDWGKKSVKILCEVVRNMKEGRPLMLAPSAYYAREFSELFEADIKSIPHAIDPSRLLTKSPRDEPGDERACPKTTLLLPSRLELEQKQPNIVFDGIAKLPRRARQNLRLVATGIDRQYEHNITGLDAIAKLAGFTAIFKKYPTMAEAYREANIVALPSRSESFGYAALESLALGIPTILNTIPTFQEIAEGNPNAHFFDGTAQGFARTASNLLHKNSQQPVPDSWKRRYAIEQWAQLYSATIERILHA